MHNVPCTRAPRHVGPGSSPACKKCVLVSMRMARHNASGSVLAHAAQPPSSFRRLGDGSVEPLNLLKTIGKGVVCVGAAMAVTGCMPAWSAPDFSSPLVDESRILVETRRQSINAQLRSLELDTGYSVRVFTKERYTTADLDAARSAWQVNRRSVVLVFDPTAPNIFGYDYIGDDVLLGPLRRPFWIELQSRYGNMFYVRDNGESEALREVVTAVDTCLRQGGCQRVPGIPDEQYWFTLVLSIVGGTVFGFSLGLEPNEVISRRWFWPILFFPLWGSLFFSFGLGPIVSRTDEVAPLVQNTVAFLVASLLFRPRPIFFSEPSGGDKGSSGS